jgi:hypothetical protein
MYGDLVNCFGHGVPPMSVESTIRRVRPKTIGVSAYLLSAGVVEIRAYADVLTYAATARWLA